MKNDKEDYSNKPIPQSDSPDTTDKSDWPETARPTPADLARSRSTFIDLFTSTQKAWQKTEAKLLGEKSPEELAAKRDIFNGLMSGVPRAWEKIEPTLPPARGRHQSGNQRPLHPAGTTDATHQEGRARPHPARRE